MDRPSKAKKQRLDIVDEEQLACAACPAPNQTPPLPGKGAAADRDEWIACTHCHTWYHCMCISLENPDEFSKWYCRPCIRASEAKVSDSLPASYKPLANVLRPPRRKSSRVKDEVDYAAIQEGMPADPVGRWNKLLDSYDFLPDRFRRMKGDQWTLDWILRDPSALGEPVLVSSSVTQPRAPSQAYMSTERSPSHLKPASTSIPGMLVPPPETTIFDVAAMVGPDTPVEVIDVASQSSSKTSWTISEWAEYFVTPRAKKQKVLNVISLEVTGTPFQPFVEAPKLVRDLDWVSRDWPETRRNKEHSDNSWPKVQRYVLMGVEGAYSDWHIDFAGSSVYYHVIWGQKTFLFAPPTTKNFSAYRNWCSSSRQDFDWLGHHLHDLTRVDIHPGETMLIPSGWLHSVYTPKNTLVVGGNFLTDWNVATQWKLVEIEEATKVPKKFRFPHLKRLTWYVAQAWHDRLAYLDDKSSPVANGNRTDAHLQEQELNVDILSPTPAIDAHAREASLPPAKVLAGISLICRTLTDDIELIHDPFLLEDCDERSVKLQKAARDAVPVHHVGKPARAALMLETLRHRLERAQCLVADNDAQRKSSSKGDRKDKKKSKTTL